MQKHHTFEKYAPTQTPSSTVNIPKKKHLIVTLHLMPILVWSSNYGVFRFSFRLCYRGNRYEALMNCFNYLSACQNLSGTQCEWEREKSGEICYIPHFCLLLVSDNDANTSAFPVGTPPWYNYVITSTQHLYLHLYGVQSCS